MCFSILHGLGVCQIPCFQPGVGPRGGYGHSAAPAGVLTTAASGARVATRSRGARHRPHQPGLPLSRVPVSHGRLKLISCSRSGRGAPGAFIDTECSRPTDRPLRLIKRRSVQIVWNVAFQTLKGRGVAMATAPGAGDGGFPRELEGQQNVKHLQLKKEEEKAAPLPTLSTERENR